jgi:hypothetical protein
MRREPSTVGTTSATATTNGTSASQRVHGWSRNGSCIGTR